MTMAIAALIISIIALGAFVAVGIGYLLFADRIAGWFHDIEVRINSLAEAGEINYNAIKRLQADKKPKREK